MIIAPVFSYDIISMPPTKDDYIFSFNGTLSGALPPQINTNFTMPLSYPIGVTFSCWFDKTDIGFNNATISCISDRNLKNVSVIIEQNIIYLNDDFRIQYFLEILINMIEPNFDFNVFTPF